MDTLKKIFPFSFKEKPDVKALVINIVIYVVAAAILNGLFVIIGLALGKIVIIKLTLDLTAYVVNLYATGGIVLTVLNYCGIVK